MTKLTFDDIKTLFDISASIIFVIISIILILIWPLTQFLLGLILTHKLLCHNEPLFPIEIWLIVNSIITISIEIILFTMFKSGKDSPIIKLFNKVTIILLFISFIWNIIGSYNFWFKCKYFNSEGSTIYLWFCLCLTYFNIGLFLIVKRFILNKQISKPPLLDIYN